MLKAAIFDMDGVIVDSHPRHKQAWRSFMISIGRHVSEEELDIVLDGRRRDDILRAFLGDLDEQQLREYGERKGRFFHQGSAELSLTDGLLEFLAALEHAGVRIAVATSAGRERARYTLEHFNLQNRFSVVVCGDDVACGKPDPEVYLRACQGIDADTGTALVIEDAVSGVIAARAAGMRCLGIADAERAPLLYRAGADHVVPDFKGLEISTVLRFFPTSTGHSEGFGRSSHLLEILR